MSIDFQVERLVPRFFLLDQNGYAFAKAIERLFEMLDAICDAGLAQLWDVESMEEWRLDEMAWEFNVPWYDYRADIESKRTVISGAKDFRDCIGTPYAVERAISDVYGTGKVEEWPEYGGEPGYFRVLTTNISALNENRERFIKLLDQAKNCRSVLENIYYYGESSAATGHAALAVVGTYGRIQITAKNYGEE